MKKAKHFAILSLLTFVLWYAVIGIIEWDINWIDFMPDATRSQRGYFILGVLIKLGLDIWLWSYIKNKYFDQDPSEEEARLKAENEKLRKMFNKDEV